MDPSAIDTSPRADVDALAAPYGEARRVRAFQAHFASRARVSLRGAALLVHRYVGLAIAVFVAVAGFTGSLLAFNHELDAAIAPSLLVAKPPFEGAKMLDPLELYARVRATLPEGSHARHVPLTLEPGYAAAFYVDPPKGQEGGAGDEVFVDPYTGDVLGSRRWGDLTQGAVNVMPFVFRLHYSLALGDVGSYVFGVAALLWTIDCFVGAYLTFPPRTQRTPGSSPQRSWLARWRHAWLLRTTKLFSLVFTWHRASGLWAWGMLLVFAWSGVALNLNEVYRPVMRASFGMQTPGYDRLVDLDEPRPEPKLSWSEARAIGRTLMATEAAKRGIEAHEERRLSYEPDHGVFRYQVRSSRDISDRYPATNVWFDGDSGALVDFEAPTGEAAGNTITTWLYHLHFGTLAAGGLPYRIFVAIMGAVVALLSVTGVWIWARKRARPAAKLWG